MESYMIYVPIVMALIGLAFMAIKRAWVLKQDAGDGKMKEISDYIYEGALAFLKAEYRLLAIFVVISSVVLAGITFIPGVKTHLFIVVAFIFGAFFSALAGNMGMKSKFPSEMPYGMLVEMQSEDLKTGDKSIITLKEVKKGINQIFKISDYPKIGEE